MLLNNQSFIKYPSSTGSVDPYASNVVLLLKGDGVDGSTTFLDSSVSNRSITNSGTNITISTTQSKYGGSSGYCNLDNTSSRLSVPNSSDFFFSSSQNYTIEYWLYKFDVSSGRGVDGHFATTTSSGTSGYIIGTFPDNENLYYRFNSTTSTETFVVPSLQWNHIAMVQVANTSLKIYLNGIEQLSFSPFTFLNNGANLRLFNTTTESRSAYCYIDSLRFTKDVARYITNFNPETDTYLAY